MPPTFVLGAATDPAGAEWLYRHLAETPTFVAGHSEAYHVLDGLGSTESASSALADLREGRPADAAALHRIAMIGNLSIYYDYFAGLLHQDPQRTLTADVTPDYAGLSVERLTEVRTEFEARGISVLPVFVTGTDPRTSDAWDAAFGDTVQYVPTGSAIALPAQNA